MTDKLLKYNKFAALDSGDESDKDDKDKSKNIPKDISKDKKNKQKISLRQDTKTNKSKKNLQVSEIEDEVIDKYFSKKKYYKNNILHSSNVPSNNDSSSNNNTSSNDIESNNIESNNIESNNIESNNIKTNNIKTNNIETNKTSEIGFTVVTKKKINRNTECIYKTIDSNFLTTNMDNYFKVLGHHNDDKSWDFTSYHNITTLYNWMDIVTFFNTLNTTVGETKFTDFDIFIMKNEISPMWEDSENRYGSICSIKIDSIDTSYDILKHLTYHIANKTLLKFNPSNWNCVNGVSYSVKKLENLNETFCIIIKLWFKFNLLNCGLVENILNPSINNMISKYSIKNKLIKPEY